MTSENMNSSETKPTYWMNKDGKPLTIEVGNKDGWVIINKQNSGKIIAPVYTTQT